MKTKAPASNRKHLPRPVGWKSVFAYFACSTVPSRSGHFPHYALIVAASGENADIPKKRDQRRSAQAPLRKRRHPYQRRPARARKHAELR